MIFLSQFMKKGWRLLLVLGLAHGDMAWAADTYSNVKITPQSQISMHFYDIQADTAPGLKQQLMASAPQVAPGKRAIGKAVYQLSWQLDASQQPQGCQLYGVQVTTKVELILPNWLQLATMPADAQASWNTFLGAMQEYEGKHKAIIKQAALAIGDGLATLPVNTSCQALRVEADRLGEMKIREAQEQARRYQSETGNGRYMGVAYPNL
ncbi:DUF922 domain-containing protein [Pseudaeromonas sharmana]|uniref:DUF922 domain-containing protein n=1 Tax=Pseudaeromonas sharmana TaxID=328412 RepID=A0ABV8CJX7_9GAMM